MSHVITAVEVDVEAFVEAIGEGEGEVVHELGHQLGNYLPVDELVAFAKAFLTNLNDEEFAAVKEVFDADAAGRDLEPERLAS